MMQCRYSRYRKGLMLVILILVCSVAQAQEVCGIDSLFGDGFQGPRTVALASHPGLQQSPGIARSIDGGSLTISVSYPSSNAQIGSDTTQVVGTYTGPTNTGITINGVLAVIHNGSFVAPSVPLDPGANTLQITARKLTDETATQSVQVNQTGSPPLMSLGVDRAVGYAPFAVRFNAVMAQLPNNAVLQGISVDYGDNSPSYSGSNFPTPFSHVYQQPGVYRTVLTVTDSLNQTYTAQRWVVIQDLAQQRGMLCDVYGHLKQRMTAQDVSGALKSLRPALRTYYQNLFASLGNNLPTTAASLGLIVTGVIGVDFAEFLVVREYPDQSRKGFPIQYTLGKDGVWRISEI